MRFLCLVPPVMNVLVFVSLDVTCAGASYF